MSTNRRDFLARVALSSAGLAAARLFGPLAHPALAENASSAQAAGNPLRFPPAFAGGDLAARRLPVTIFDDAPTTLLTLGGSYPSPTIRLRRGEELDVQLVNDLDEPTNIHWHGLLAPADMDGHPMHVVAAGASRRYRFRVDQRAGTYWYHPHAHMSTARQAYMGMAGLVIVEDPAESAIGLPSGERDVPLVIQDRRFGANRSLAYAPSMMDTMTGLLGSMILVNGTPEPFLEVSRDLYRFRVLNGSNARIYHLGLDDGATFHVIAGDAGLIDRPRPVSSVWLAPGERVELLVDFSSSAEGSSVVLKSLQYDNASSPGFQGYPFDIIRFDVTRPSASTAVVPETLVPLDRAIVTPATPRRTLRLAMIHQHPAMIHTINGKGYEMSRVDERVAAGSTEVWELINDDNDEPHPMHIHASHFQVLERNGAAPTEPKEIGWNDTVIVRPLERVTIAVRFGEETGMFVAHCHNLEHEDSGMMINLQVEPTSGIGADAHRVHLEPIAPNPARGAATLTVHLAIGGDVDVSLYDVVGRRYPIVAWTDAPAGEHRVNLDLRGLSTGVYAVRVVCGGRSAEQMLSVRA